MLGARTAAVPSISARHCVTPRPAEQRRRHPVPRQGREPAEPAVLRLRGLGAGGRALVHDRRERVSSDAGVIEYARQAPHGARKLVAVGDVAGIDMVAQAEAVAAVEGVAESDLAPAVAFPLVAAVGGEGPSVEVGGVVGEFALAGEALGAEAVEQGGLGLLEFVLGGRAGLDRRRSGRSCPGRPVTRSVWGKAPGRGGRTSQRPRSRRRGAQMRWTAASKG